MLLVVILTEFRGRTSFTLLEDTVEIADVVEAAGVAHFDDGHGTVGKETRSIAQTHIDDVLGYAFSRTELEETAEGSGCHRGQFCKGAQTDFLTEIPVDVLFHTPYPPAVNHIFGACKGTGGKQMIVGRL